jgi:hypothetical protein
MRIALRTRIPAAAALADVVKSLRAEVLEAIEQRNIPLRLVSVVLGHGHSEAWHPVAQIFFAVEHPLHVPSSSSGLNWSVVPPEVEQGEAPTRCDMTVVVRHGFDGAAIEASAATDLYELTTIRSFAHSFRETARAAIAAPYTPLRRLNVP